MRTATLRHVVGVGIEIHSPYDANFVAELKAAVPHFARKWMPERKIWLVSDDYRAAVLQLLRTYFAVVDLDREEKPRERQHDGQQQQQQREQEEPQQKHRHDYTYYSSPHTSTSHVVMHLLPTAPPELIRAAFHCLAKLYHPDLGGDTAKMQVLNSAYHKLKR